MPHRASGGAGDEDGTAVSGIPIDFHNRGATPATAPFHTLSSPFARLTSSSPRTPHDVCGPFVVPPFREPLSDDRPLLESYRMPPGVIPPETWQPAAPRRGNPSQARTSFAITTPVAARDGTRDNIVTKKKKQEPGTRTFFTLFPRDFFQGPFPPLHERLTCARARPLPRTTTPLHTRASYNGEADIKAKTPVTVLLQRWSAR